MPVPNDWGVKKDWAPAFKPEKPKPKGIPCPRCGHFTVYFDCIREMYENGTMDLEGDYEGGDVEIGSSSITCPRCGKIAFSSSSGLREYVRDYQKLEGEK